MWPAGLHTIQVGGPHKGDVDTQVAVIRRTIKAGIDAEGNRRPCWTVLSAVEADLDTLLDDTSTQMRKGGADTHLICGSGLQLLKDLERLLLGCQSHDDPQTM